MLAMKEYGIGNTPMVELPPAYGNGNRILLKLEQKNALGSMKARTAYWMIHSLPKLLGKHIVESTSGNLGFALDFFCREAGLTFTALVDPSITTAKLDRLKAAEVHYQIVEAETGFDYRSSRIRLAQRMMDSGVYHWVNQYDNDACVRAHEMTTAPEIWEQTGGSVTHIVCPMGSCGTICGIGRYFKKKAPTVQIIGVEPYGSTIFGSFDGPYINVGAGLVGKPGNLVHNPNTVDQAFTISDDTSIAYARQLILRYGLKTGVTTGMAYAQAVKLSQMEQNAVIVVISPDGMESYGQYLS